MANAEQDLEGATKSGGPEDAGQANSGQQEARVTALIAQIAELSKSARTLWFALLGFLAFSVVTLLGVEDKDFFAYGADTALPLLRCLEEEDSPTLPDE